MTMTMLHAVVYRTVGDDCSTEDLCTHSARDDNTDADRSTQPAQRQWLAVHNGAAGPPYD